MPSRMAAPSFNRYPIASSIVIESHLDPLRLISTEVHSYFAFRTLFKFRTLWLPSSVPQPCLVCTSHSCPIATERWTISASSKTAVAQDKSNHLGSLSTVKFVYSIPGNEFWIQRRRLRCSRWALLEGVQEVQRVVWKLCRTV